MSAPNKYPLGSELIYTDEQLFTANYIRYDSHNEVWYSKDGMRWYSEDMLRPKSSSPMDRAIEIHAHCSRIYGDCTDGSFEMCLSHEGYYAALREAGK